MVIQHPLLTLLFIGLLVACNASIPPVTSPPSQSTQPITPPPAPITPSSVVSQPLPTPSSVVSQPLPTPSSVAPQPLSTPTIPIAVPSFSPPLFTKISIYAGGPMGADDGILLKAMFNNPIGVTRDRQGNIYLADSGNHRIRKITPGGVVSTFSGSTVGFSDGGRSAVKFRNPYDLTTDRQGLVYVTDRGNHRIRRLNAEGSGTTLAGNSSRGYQDGSGLTALFDNPAGIAMSSEGDLYIADSGNNCIRRLAPDGTVTTFAGSTSSGDADGTLLQARFKAPLDIVFSPQGDVLYVADAGNHRIRQIDLKQGLVSTLAGKTVGFKDGFGSAAEFKGPDGLAVDPQGRLYAVEFNNNSIRQLTPDGHVSTITRHSGVSGATDGSLNIAQLNGPQAILVIDNVLLVSDSLNHRLRRVE